MAVSNADWQDATGCVYNILMIYLFLNIIRISCSWFTQLQLSPIPYAVKCWKLPIWHYTCLRSHKPANESLVNWILCLPLWYTACVLTGVRGSAFHGFRELKIIWVRGWCRQHLQSISKWPERIYRRAAKTTMRLSRKNINVNGPLTLSNEIKIPDGAEGHHLKRVAIVHVERSAHIGENTTVSVL